MAAMLISNQDDGGAVVPLLREVMPEVVDLLVETLTDLGEVALATTLAGQRCYGRCRCRPQCQFVRTAPVGSSSPLMVWLRQGEEIVGEASLTADATMITEFDLIDAVLPGIGATWREAAERVGA